MRVWLAIVLCATALTCGVARAQPAQLTPQAFGDQFVARVQAAAPRADVQRRDALGMRVHVPEGTDSSINLDRAYHEYQADPAQLDAILARWVRLSTQGPDSTHSQDRIVSVLRTNQNVDAYEEALRQGANFSPIVRRPFRGDLLEVLAFDSADSLTYVTAAALADVGLTPDAAWTLAPQNLPARLGPLDAYAVEGRTHLGYLTGGNGLTPSTLTAADICAGEAARRLFLVLDRNAVLIADGGDAAARTAFAQAVRELRGNGQSMSETPLECSNGRLEVAPLGD